MGVYLGGRYPMLLHNKLIKIQSSRTSRTIDSGKFCVAGMIPYTPNQQFYEKLIDEWKPIELEVISTSEDHTIYGLDRFCQKYDDFLYEYEGSAEYLQYLSDYAETMKDLTKHCDKSVKDFNSVMSIYDTLSTELHQNKT